jgi:hypothetical protein
MAMTDEVKLDGAWARIEFQSIEDGKGVRLLVDYNPKPDTFAEVTDMPVCHVLMSQLAELTVGFLQNYTLENVDPPSDSVN